MPTPVISNLDNVNKTYTADGQNYALNPATQRFQLASTIPVPASSIQPGSKVVIPPTPIDNTMGAVNASNNELVMAQTANTTAEGGYNQANKDLQSLTDQLMGKTADTQSAEQAAGIPSINQNINELQDISRQKTIEYNTNPYSLAGQGRGITTGVLRGQEAVKQRQLGIDIMLNNSNLQAAQGKLQLAQATVDRAIAAKYDPILARIESQKTILENNKYLLSRSDKKLADAKQVVLDAQKIEIEQKMANEKSIQQIAMKLSEYGTSPAIVKDVMASKTIEDALFKAGTNLQNPKAQLELESLRLDNVLTKVKIAQEQRQTSLLGQPTVTERKAIESAIKEAKASVPATQDKIDAITALESHSGMSSRVGTSIQSRTPQGTLGALGKALTIVGIPSLVGDTVSKLSGSGQEFAGGVHKLTSGLSIDNLIAAKARGATFGALSDAELRILSSAASAINDWEEKDDKGVGQGVWNIDEKSFKKELKTIQDLSRRALQQSQGTLYSKEEQEVLNKVFPDKEPTASQYFK